MRAPALKLPQAYILGTEGIIHDTRIMHGTRFAGPIRAAASSSVLPPSPILTPGLHTVGPLGHRPPDAAFLAARWDERGRI